MKKIILVAVAAFGLVAANAANAPLVPEGATALHSISSKAANTSTDVWASNQVGPYLQIYNADNSKFILQADDTVEAKFKFNETGDAKGRFDYGTENNTFTSPSINDTSKHTIVASGKSLKIDGTAVTIASSVARQIVPWSWTRSPGFAVAFGSSGSDIRMKPESSLTVRVLAVS